MDCIRPEWRKLFGDESIAEVLRTMQHPVILEIDHLLHSGALSVEEAVDYLAVLDENVELRASCIDVGRHAVERLVQSGRFAYYAEKSVTRRGQFVPERGLHQLLISFLRLTSVAYTGVQAGYRSTLERDLRESFEGHLFLALQAWIETQSLLRVDEVIAYYLDYDAAYPNVNDAHAVRFVHLDRAMTFVRSRLDARPRALTDDDRALALQDLRALVCSRRIPTMSMPFGRHRIEFQGDATPEFREAGYILHFGNIAIAADESIPPISRGGRSIPGNVVIADLDRATGRLMVPLTGVAFASCGNPERVAALEDAIILHLWEQLTSAEDDPVLCASRTPIEDAPLKAAPIEDAVRTALAKAEILPLPAPDVPAAAPAPTRARSTLASLRGQSDRDVLRRFTQLFGPPIRQEGSHHVFLGRNGRPYPIALHAKNDVGVGLLVKCLRMLGVTPDEYLAR